MAMGRRQTKHAAEHDAFTTWRPLYCYLQRPGVTSKIKRGARRRERHEARSSIREAQRRDEASEALEYEMQDFDDGSQWWWLETDGIRWESPCRP